jgi:Fur family zinc uptake transcriptional regulator
MVRDVTDSLKAVEALCRQRGLQLTDIRREVLEHLYAAAAKPLSAYELLDRIGQRHGRRLGPPTVHRALEFLIEQGFVSRIESRNAFVPCAHPDHRHSCVFFVCSSCSTSVEIENHTLEKLIDTNASELGFRISRRVMELEGTCSDCRALGSGEASL